MKIKIVILFLFIGILSSCSNNLNNENNILNNSQNIEQFKNFKSVGVKDFKKEIEKKDGILIDIRTPKEVRQGVISGVDLNLDYYSKDFLNNLKSLDKNKKYLIYCRSGSRSGNTFEAMKKLGFKNVINLQKGINSWIKSGEELSVFENKEKISKKYFTKQEVAIHNKNNDCWTIIENNVYNITSFFGSHPGGDGKLEILCGVDGTKDFIGKHGDNEKAKIKKEEFYIGELK